MHLIHFKLKKHSIIYQLLLIGSPLFIGLMIYAMSRSGSIQCNKWLNVLGITFKQHYLPNLIKYSLPDGLFALSSMLTLYIIWKWKAPLLWEILVIFLLILSELLQGNYIAGTYDPIDLLSIGFAIIISQLICIYVNYKNHTYTHD